MIIVTIKIDHVNYLESLAVTTLLCTDLLCTAGVYLKKHTRILRKGKAKRANNINRERLINYLSKFLAFWALR